MEQGLGITSTYVVFGPRAYKGWHKRRQADAAVKAMRTTARRHAAGKKKWGGAAK